MNRLEQSYHYDEDGEIDEFCTLLDCAEQILYFALKEYKEEYKVDYKKFFCQDINLRLEETQKISLHFNKDYGDDNPFFIEKKIEVDQENVFLKLKEEIDRGSLIVIRTMIDMLPHYEAYKPNIIGTRDGHFFLIVGYDENKFFYVDSPFMLKESCCIKLENNKAIGIVEEDVLAKAFAVLCEASTLSVQSEHLLDWNMEDRIELILNRIVENYYLEPQINTNNSTNRQKYIGRSALERILEYSQSEQPVEVLSLILKDFYFTHLMLAKRKILRMCLMDEKKYSQCNTTEKLIGYIDQSIREWDKFKLVLVKNLHVPNKNLKQIVSDKVNKLITIEDSIVKEIRELISESKQNSYTNKDVLVKNYY